MPAYARYIVSSLLSVALVILFIALPIRLLMSQVFLQTTYSFPWIQPDVYGFTNQQRLELASDTLLFLLYEYSDVWLAQKTIDRDAMPPQSCILVTDAEELCYLYNEREVQHMVDVQRIIQDLLALVLPSCAVILLGGFTVWWRKEWRVALMAFRHTNILILSLILVCMISATVAWDTFFTAFHSLFFEGDSWLFYYWDTLIRLFPESFWYTSTIILSVLIVLELAFLHILANYLGKYLKAKELS